MSKNQFNTATQNDAVIAMFANGLIGNSEVSHMRSNGAVITTSVALTKPMEALEKEVNKRFGKSNQVVVHSQADVDALFIAIANLSYPAAQATDISFTSLLAATIMIIASDYSDDKVFIKANAWNNKLQGVVDGQFTQLASLIIKNQLADAIEVGFDCTPLSDDATAGVPVLTGLETVQGGSALLNSNQSLQLDSIVMTYSGATGGVTATAVSGQSDVNT